MARLTPVGRGAVATIRLCGDLDASNLIAIQSDQDSGSASGHLHLSDLNSLFQAANGRPLTEQPMQQIVFGQWGTSHIEELVVCRVASNVIEIHCHGGDAAVQRILLDLSRVGCCIVDWREQETSVESLFDAECLEVLCHTSTWRTTKIVLEQSNGLLREAFVQLLRSSVSPPVEGLFESVKRSNRLGQNDKLKPLNIPNAECGQATNQIDVSSLRSQVDRLLCWADFGLHLSTPWSVVLTGRPNVGKSTLINALLGYQRSIVFDEPGTTRDVVTGETAFEGWPVILADTAGIRETTGTLESAGIELARERLESADLQIVLLDVSRSPTDDDERLLAEWPDALVVAHKSDLINRWGDRLPKHAIAVSSITSDGVLELQRQLVNRLVPVVPDPGTAIPITERQIQILLEIRTALTAEGFREGVERLLGLQHL